MTYTLRVGVWEAGTSPHRIPDQNLQDCNTSWHELG
jgi:hypothetical protein